MKAPFSLCTIHAGGLGPDSVRVSMLYHVTYVCVLRLTSLFVLFILSLGGEWHGENLSMACCKRPAIPIADRRKQVLRTPLARPDRLDLRRFFVPLPPKTMSGPAVWYIIASDSREHEARQVRATNTRGYAHAGLAGSILRPGAGAEVPHPGCLLCPTRCVWALCGVVWCVPQV